MKQKIWLYISIGISLFIITILSYIFVNFINNRQGIEKNSEKVFAIIPHFALQPKTLEKFYHFLKTTYNIDNKEKLNIIIISPDHFDTSKNNIDMLCTETKNFCYKNICLQAGMLPATKNSWCLSGNITKEHGLGEHFIFIKKIFPQAVIFPIVVKPRKFIGNTELINTLSGYNLQGKTIIIASVDFSHYVNEDFARLHDRKSMYVLNTATTTSEYNSIEVDCPSCLHIVNTIAQHNQYYPKLFLRDSSSEIVGKDLSTGNTSRQFIYYTTLKKEINGVTIAFFGDLIFDRQISEILSWTNKINRYFSEFFQNGKTNLILDTHIHRKLFGIDIVGLNLETPIVDDKANCQTSWKYITFCSSSSILPYLKNIGFTIMNIANNHSMDGWIQAHLETIKNIKNNNLNYIWYMQDGEHFEKNYQQKIEIRGIKIALQWFDFTITPRNLFARYCNQLQQNKSEGYINIVSSHRGREYDTTHNTEQESLGKKLIECGADIIIGHHPHTIQDIWRYQGKPIIYSLGNFLFDMNTQTTKTWWYVLIDYENNGKINIYTGKIKASIY